jgi:hypothetical protein
LISCPETSGRLTPVWTTILEWIKGIGVGSLVGVFVGARLARHSQDRQFDRQAAAQRVDRGRAIYSDAKVLGHDLTGTLSGHFQGRLSANDAADKVEAAHKKLFEATVRLSTEGATQVAHQYERAMVQSGWIRAAITGELEERPLPGPERCWAAWHELAAELDAADTLWARWQEAQTLRPSKSRRWLRAKRFSKRIGDATSSGP